MTLWGKGGFFWEVSLPVSPEQRWPVEASVFSEISAGQLWLCWQTASVPKGKCLYGNSAVGCGIPGSVLSSHHFRKVSISQERTAELMGWAGFEVLADPLTLCPVSSQTTKVARRLWHPESSSIWLLYSSFDGETSVSSQPNLTCQIRSMWVIVPFTLD